MSRCVWAADDTTKQRALAIDALKALHDQGEKLANAGAAFGALITTWETRVVTEFGAKRTHLVMRRPKSRSRSWL
jgi:hypothetical protein